MVKMGGVEKWNVDEIGSGDAFEALTAAGVNMRRYMMDKGGNKGLGMMNFHVSDREAGECITACVLAVMKFELMVRKLDEKK